MKKLSFKGGLHIYDGKEFSKGNKTIEYFPKGEMVYPLSQHIGAPSIPIVEKGESVVAGQMIARANGFVSAPIFATISGNVKVIEKRRVASGDLVDSIIIDNDLEYREATFKKPKSYTEMTREEIIMIVQTAGIVGMGGAGFPTHVKLSPKEPDKIEYIIINCAECEPYLTSDYRRMLEEPEKIYEGLKILLHLFKNAKGIIAIEDNKRDCIDIFKEITANDNRVITATLKTNYPQGSERQLIYATTKRAINSSKLPSDVGCIVQNADTTVAIYNAIVEGRPLLNRIVTVTGNGISKPCNFRVRMGTSYSELIEEAGGFVGVPGKVISGGPMMGIALFDTDIPIVKTSSAILVLAEDDVSKSKVTACINCGKCVEVCPSRLVPSRLSKLADNYRGDEFAKEYGMECMECGCCSYVCPAKRQLAQSIKSMKKIELARAKAKAK